MTEPQQVAIASIDPGATPIPVSVHPNTLAQPAKLNGTTIGPRVQDATDATEKGQRKVNLLWEGTQSLAALMVLGCFMFIIIYLILFSPADRTAALISITGFASIIMSTYFTRTNHTKVGGVQQGDTGR